ncbi:DUF485 domain-containing protein [Corynebacterium sp. 13CS0277]|uniref:DUF485 domain-containing protein n=1 Tax=Corynebacterium sp. 13CS0277 TaxID=2071994 RepID=UPI000D03F37B|nr:DUF485 domain-containing protein [Corynebacterium sp. 13CS0277]PRQ11007.1 DUF485 domain-containing protein [Corynebacterium sp. 13CS0277]
MSAHATPADSRREPTAAEFRAMQQSPEFVDLKSSFRKFAFPMTAAFFLWYLLYVLLAVYDPGLYSKPVIGNVNLGVFMGLAQFATTFLITAAYIRYANKNIEPRATAIRKKMED